MPQIPGISFDFGAETLLIPPLSLGDLELLQERLGQLQTGALDPASVATVLDATHAALRRNYPDITRERVAQLVDLANMGDVIANVMDVAGLRRKELAAGKPTAPAETASP